MSNKHDRAAADGGEPRATQVLQGIGGAPGVAVAPALVVRSRVLNVPERLINAVAAEAEWGRFEAAREQTRALDIPAGFGLGGIATESGSASCRARVLVSEVPVLV